MTLFFNLERLEKESKCDINKFMKILYLHHKGRLFKPYKLTGTSYLLNPDPLFLNSSKVDILYIVQYIRLAARRDYFLYKTYNVATLDLSYYPDINMSAIRSNPLLKIQDNQIFFLYEEARKKKGN